MFDLLAPHERRELLASGRRRRFARKEVIFHEGDPGGTLHLVLAGHVAVRVHTPMGDIATLAILGPGQTLGELALLDPDARHSASCIALETTDTWSLHRDQVNRLRREYAAIDQFAIQLLAVYVRRLSEQLVQALYLSADQRVAQRVLDLAMTYGDGRDIPVTQDDVATMAGTSRATVNRVFGELEAAGALTVARGRIPVRDRARVARAAR
jgi:CRP/FNR family transcriptional regulator, cyclic AMP receptor protein